MIIILLLYNMKKISILILILIFLNSCWKEEELISEEVKQDFFIETQKGEDFTSGPSFKKVGRISSQSEISLSAQASWIIESIPVKVWDDVTIGQPLVRLSDSIGSYEINLQRASLSVERAKISYDSSKVSLDKQVEDARISMEKAERNLEAFRKNRENNLILSQDTLQNAELENISSTAALQIQQLENNLEKAKLDFEIKKSTDEQQVSSYDASIKKDFNALIILLTDVVQFSDEILWVSQINKDINNSYEDFLGAKNKSQKRNTEILLQELIDLQNSTTLDEYEWVILNELTQEKILELTGFVDETYNKIKVLLNELENTLNNSLRSIWTLGDTEINAFTSEINAYQASLQGNYSWFIASSNAMKTFLRTYEDTQNSLLRALELQEQEIGIQTKALLSAQLNAEIWLDTTELSSQDTLQDFEDAFMVAKNNHINANKNRELSLRNLQNAISDAQVSYNSALKEYKKLTIVAPVSWKISRLEVDLWQEILPGNHILTIAWDGESIVELAFSWNERNFISLWQKVSLELSDEEVIQGNIFSLSNVADNNFNYIAEIITSVDLDADIWKLVRVIVPTSDNIMLLPLNILKPQGDNIALVTTYNEGKFEEVRLRLGESYDDQIEILSCAQECAQLNIVLSDISNYDENIFSIIER